MYLPSCALHICRRLACVFLVVLGLMGLYSSEGIAAPSDTVVTNCTEAGLRAAIVAAPAGGQIVFQCGSDPVIISTHRIDIVKSVIIDGGGKVALSGSTYGNIAGMPVVMPLNERLFAVAAFTSLILRNITLQDAFDRGGSYPGGCVYVFADASFFTEDVIMDNCRVDNNRMGGAVYTAGITTLTRTIVRNSQGYNGGALYVDSTADVNLINSQILRDCLKSNGCQPRMGVRCSCEQATLPNRID